MRAALCCLLLVAACAVPPGPDDGTDPEGAALGSGDPQAKYEYPGCANEDYGCPRLLTVSCALESIRQKYSACTQDADCVAIHLADDCAGYSSCSTFVASSGVAAFREEAGAELARYCGPSPGCRSSGSCVQLVPACESGRCVGRMVSGP